MIDLACELSLDSPMCDPISLFEKKWWGKASVTPSGEHEGETDRRLPWTWNSCKALTHVSCCPVRRQTAGRQPNQLRKHSRLFTKSGGKRFGPTGCKLDIRDPEFLLLLKWLTSTSCSCPPHPYPIVSQLQTDLYEGVGADAKLLDASFPEFGEGEHVAVHVGGHRLGHRQRAAHLSLHLTGGRAQLPQGDRQKETFLTPSAPLTGLRSNPVCNANIL